jgi:hypothetical protein
MLMVAGTSHRKELITTIAGRYQRQRPEDPIAAGIVLRQPSNPHDPNAVRVLIDGFHVGFLARDDARAWQRTLVECERRRQTLVGMVRFVGPERWGLRLQLRDGLPGFDGPVTATQKAHYAKVTGDGVPVFLDAARLGMVTDALTVDDKQPPTTSQAATLLAARIQRALDEVYGHAAAVKRAGDVTEAEELLDLASELNDMVNGLLNADDAEERLTDDLAFTADLLIEELRMSVQAEGD